MFDKKAQVGFVIALVAVVAIGVTYSPASPEPTGVKQQVIDLPADAFDGDPQLQKAVQQQLQAPQSTQAVGPAPSSSADMLQPSGKL